MSERVSGECANQEQSSLLQVPVMTGTVNPESNAMSDDKAKQSNKMKV